jgi:hypothetical protein
MYSPREAYFIIIKDEGTLSFHQELILFTRVELAKTINLGQNEVKYILGEV